MGLRDADTEKITLRLPARYLKALDFLVQVDDFPSRSEAVRAAIRDFVYARVELVTEKLKKMQDAERTLAERRRSSGSTSTSEKVRDAAGGERGRVRHDYLPPNWVATKSHPFYFHRIADGSSSRSDGPPPCVSLTTESDSITP